MHQCTQSPNSDCGNLFAAIVTCLMVLVVEQLRIDGPLDMLPAWHTLDATQIAISGLQG
jgi:hypothetical protein